MKGKSGILIRLGIFPNLVGYRYLEYGIELLNENPDRIYYVTKDLYPVIAQRYGTSWLSVEHAIRTAVAICWERGNRTFLNEIAGYTLKTRPTASEFIAILYKFQNMENEIKENYMTGV